MPRYCCNRNAVSAETPFLPAKMSLRRLRGIERSRAAFAAGMPRASISSCINPAAGFVWSFMGSMGVFDSYQGLFVPGPFLQDRLAVAQITFMPALESMDPIRRSASTEAALCAEMNRIEAMTIAEGVKSALSLPERFSWLAPVHPSQSPTPDVRDPKACGRK